MRRNGENDLENLFAESNIDDYLPLSQPIFRNKSVIFCKIIAAFVYRLLILKIQLKAPCMGAL
jgi:hypothetical protein